MICLITIADSCGWLAINFNCVAEVDRPDSLSETCFRSICPLKEVVKRAYH
jgi:hypothetical protein